MWINYSVDTIMIGYVWLNYHITRPIKKIKHVDEGLLSQIDQGYPKLIGDGTNTNTWLDNWISNHLNFLSNAQKCYHTRQLFNILTHRETSYWNIKQLRQRFDNETIENTQCLKPSSLHEGRRERERERSLHFRGIRSIRSQSVLLHFLLKQMQLS